MDQSSRVFHGARLHDAFAVLAATFPYAGERLSETLEAILSEVIEAARGGDARAAAEVAKMWLEVIRER